MTSKFIEKKKSNKITKKLYLKNTPGLKILSKKEVVTFFFSKICEIEKRLQAIEKMIIDIYK